MPERVQDWWARRQFSRGRDVPYDVGTYREAWASFPALIRQYHPELNAGIVLTQIPPAADVLLLWQCDAGHLFVATPTEQRTRPGRQRRRSAWCPECSALAIGAPPRRVEGAEAVATAVARPGRARPSRGVCPKTPALAVGEAFVSGCAPRPASAVEARVRADLFARLGVTAGRNAVRVSRPFFDHLEVWPDMLLPELRIAVEYDSTGRHGLEHVGQREETDRRKDRMLRAAGWEVVRLRTAKLVPLGPYDIALSGWNRRSLDRLIDAFREIRGPLMVDAYLQ
ncbi:zinc-ribbon domain-containing protein [Microbacterium sp. ARD31]|uniref:zinc-ribbon domain-containing protein n=1 Tax=Microbacterium sp. ARD31 TaxID=2962576 RepID=UPI00288268D0|nr:zinc-ribbon domain-containing protein [Microbacterium sp. ARD31]MDT0180235.1 zinc-ribbon domain-containing protein [Microbacterium sp. ARD31]